MATGLAEYDKEYVFYVYYPGALKDSAKIEDCWWRRVEIDNGASPGKPVHIELPTLGYGNGDLALVAVPRKLAEKNPIGEAAWFKDAVPEILPVKGDLKVIVLYSRNGPTELDYRLERRDGQFTLTLLNPGRLQAEKEPDAARGTPESESNSTVVTALIAGGVLLLVIAIVWRIRRPASTRS
jgi:hypothetical protein